MNPPKINVTQGGTDRKTRKIIKNTMTNATINHESNHKTLITRTHSVKQQKTHFTFELSVNSGSENQLLNG